MIKLISSDLNGTLVQQHTISDMIRLYSGQQKFEQAQDIFQKQMDGKASIEETFALAGPLTKGLRLRDALEYTHTDMKYMDGFREFLDELHQREIPLIINSTGYLVTMYAMQAQFPSKIEMSIGNDLHFGLDGDMHSTLSAEELQRFVQEFFYTDSKQASQYDRIQATGEITLSIKDENAKVALLLGYVKQNFPQMNSTEIVHMGDTMGDSAGILDIARVGGIGIAFNYNLALEQHLREKMKKEDMIGNIVFIDPKGPRSNLRKVSQCLFY